MREKTASMKTENRGRFWTPVYILMAAVLWGTAGTGQAFAPDAASPLALSAVRMSIGGVSLLILAMSTQAFRPRETWSVLQVVLSAVALSAFNICYFTGLSRTGVAVGTVVAIGSAPIFAGLLGWLFRKVKPTPLWYLATLMAIGGCSLLFLNQGDIVVDSIGVAAALGAGLSYASYTVVSKKLLEEHATFAVLAVVFACSAAVLGILAAGENWTWILSARGAMVSLHLGLVTVALAYVLFSKGLLNTSAATAVSLTLAEPLTAATLGVLVLKEAIGFQSIVGIVLMGVGLVTLMVGETRFKKRVV